MSIIVKALSSLVNKNGILNFLIPAYTDTLIPLKWRHSLRMRNSPSVGKENNFQSLNKKGFEENKKLFKSLVKNWEETEKQANSHYEAIERSRQKRIKEFEKKIKELEEFEV